MARKVLLVDNDRLFVQLLTELARDEGFTAITAYDGLEGVEEAREELPDFILVDLVMPQMAGARLLRYLEGDQRLARIPIVLLSWAVPKKMADAREAGADACIPKVPFGRLMEEGCHALARGTQAISPRSSTWV